MPAVRLGARLRFFWRVHRSLMSVTGGRFGRVGRLPALLLTTRGRKTGEPRNVALNYIRDRDSFVVIASYAGEEREPAWWLNLRAAPDAAIAVDGKRMRVKAREAEGVERHALWARFVARDPAYDEYQTRTSRRLPVVVLEPAGDPHPLIGDRGS